jgi:hypothetical protein
VKRFIVPRAFRTVKGFSREGWGFGAKEAVRAAPVFPSRARSAAEEAGAATASSAALHSNLAKVLACREDFLGSPKRCQRCKRKGARQLLASAELSALGFRRISALAQQLPGRALGCGRSPP